MSSSLIWPTTWEKNKIVPIAHTLSTWIVLRIGWTHHWSIPVLIRVALAEQFVWLWTFWTSLVIILFIHILILHLFVVVIIRITFILIWIAFNFILWTSSLTTSVEACRPYYLFSSIFEDYLIFFQCIKVSFLIMNSWNRNRLLSWWG